jgi:sialidase-1
MINYFSFFIIEIIAFILILNLPFNINTKSHQLVPAKADFYQVTFKEQQRYQILKNITIYEGNGEYCAWPSVIKASNGDLLVMFSHRDEHISPIGDVAYLRSTDKGESWSKPSKLYDSKISDGGGGFITLSDGGIISLFGSVMLTKDHFLKTYAKSYYPETLKKWIDIVEDPEYKNQNDKTGAWMCISKDNGYSWTKSERGPESVHGGIQLQDGSVMVASYREYAGNIAVFHQKKIGENWKVDTLKMPKFSNFTFSEPHILQMRNGRIIIMIRTTEQPYDDSGSRNLLWETYSDDNGRSWLEPFPTPIWGFPPHLLLLSDGRALCSYGYRRPPFGQRACISEDGVTWKIEDEIIIRNDGINRDLGYPASIEIEPGKILTVYYQVNLQNVIQSLDPPHPDRKKPGILGTIWEIN